MTDQVHCNDCGTPIEEPPDTPPERRAPCPSCASTARSLPGEITLGATLRDSLKFKLKSATGKTLSEGFSGDDFSWKEQRWVQKERLFDQEKDQYKEIITDPKTGEIIHHCEEPLSQHRGHGSAKKKNKPKAG